LVCSTALLLVCLELKSDSFSYRTQLHSIPKLQHYRPKYPEIAALPIKRQIGRPKQRHRH
jgi:hypothetical protein